MPNIPEPYTLTATEALRLIEAGDLTSADWFRSCLERIDAREPEVMAWATLNEQALSEVEARDRHGKGPSIPVGAKDIIDVAGLPTMMGTDFHDPTPVTREGGSVSLMREAGCVFLGKTVSTELGHRAPGPTRNPHSPRHTPGGSSSGSAAAVGDMMVPLCLGTQTSGSVIRPAAYCGVIGYKPTYNDFDKSGILPNGPSMDTLGILARSIEDVSLLRGILLEEPAGPVDPLDLTSLRFALITAEPWDQADSETQTLVSGLADGLAQKGATRIDAGIDDVVARLIKLHDTISGYEFRRSIAFERIHYLDKLSAALREGRLATGHSVSNAEYHAAIQEVARLRVRLAEAFEGVDILVLPSAPSAALERLDYTGPAIFNSAWSLSGNPALTLPLFKSTSSGLPIGCQFIGGYAQDANLLAATKAIFKGFTT